MLYSYNTNKLQHLLTITDKKKKHLYVFLLITNAYYVILI
jgi:hypothetical protein